MNNASSFLHGPSDDPNNSSTYLWHMLYDYREQLRSMRATLLYGMNLQEVTKENIVYCDTELRNIMRNVDILRQNAYIYQFIGSIDEFISFVQKVQLNLYTASTILSKKATTREYRMFYQLLQECPGLLADAIDCFVLE